MSSGHIVERNGSFRVMVYAGRDPVTGRKRYVTRTVRGNRKDAERVRNQMLVDVQQGKTSPASATFGDLLDAWYDAASPDWSARTASEHRRVIVRPVLNRPQPRAAHGDFPYPAGEDRGGEGDPGCGAPVGVRSGDGSSGSGSVGTVPGMVVRSGSMSTTRRGLCCSAMLSRRART